MNRLENAQELLSSDIKKLAGMTFDNIKILRDMILVITILKQKGVITDAEIKEERLKFKSKSEANNNGIEKSAERSSIQSKDTGNHEDNS